MKVFWSWQSDHRRQICRDLIKEALEESCKRVAVSLELTESERPTLDHDTKGEPGMVDITEAILRKIDQSSVFVADLTPISKSDTGKEIANPNVLIELGYALKVLGPERIIAVINRAFGGNRAEDLPFNIRHRRGPITFRLGKDATPEKTGQTRDELSNKLTEALRLCVTRARSTQVSTNVLAGRAARRNDFSVWFESGEKLLHQNSLGRAGTVEVEVIESPRSYMRIIPEAWEAGVPKRSVVYGMREEQNARLWALGWYSGRVRSGDDGQNNLGILQYGVDEIGEHRRTWTATQWFSDTGEIWGFDGDISHDSKGRRMLHPGPILQGWRRFLNNGIGFLSHFRAKGTTRVEAGVVGLRGIVFPTQFPNDPPDAIDDWARFDLIDRDWSEEKRLAFLTNAYNAVLEAFGLEAVSEDTVRASLDKR